MADTIFFYLFMTISIIHMSHLGMYIVGANFYDIWQFSRQANQKERRGRKALVTVVVPAHNEERGIIKTLDSVCASSYKNIEIIVVDDGSTDRTAQIVRNYIRTQTKIGLRTYRAGVGRNARTRRQYIRLIEKYPKITLVTQENAGKGAAVNNGIKNFARGSLIMTLDADSTIYSDAIANTVRYFSDKKVIGVAANVRVMDDHSMLGVLQKIEHIIGYRTKKFYTVANCEFVVGGVASTYRMKTLKEVGYYDTDTQTEDIGLSMKIVARKGNRKWRIIYAADVVAGTEGVQTYKALFKQRYRWKMGMLQNLIKNRSLMTSRDKKYGRMMTAYRIPMAFIGEIILLTEPVLLAYILYLSVQQMSLSAFIGAYIIITGYIIWTLVPDEHMKVLEKFKYGLLAPCMYFMFYVMNAVQITAMVRCLYNYKQVTGKVKTDGRWASPERIAA
ncbi:glycosyltransferase [Pedobacter sp.]|nr:glycosyltransferase [Candidatus Saccharibacteria bacterium]